MYLMPYLSHIFGILAAFGEKFSEVIKIAFSIFAFQHRRLKAPMLHCPLFAMLTAPATANRRHPRGTSRGDGSQVRAFPAAVRPCGIRHWGTPSQGRRTACLPGCGTPPPSLRPEAVRSPHSPSRRFSP